MQITCYECEARYNVHDDKVQGRNFKFRCKACGAPVFFSGPEPGFEEDPTLPDISLPQRSLDSTLAAAPATSEMTGVRNENSVLFAADTLKDLAPRGARAVRPEADPEGSGLIDIRALAQAAAEDSAARAERDTTEIDELVAFGTAPLPLAAPRSSARRRGVRPSGTFLFLCSGFGVAAVVLVAVMAAASLVSAEPGRMIATPEQLQVKPLFTESANALVPDPGIAPAAPVVPAAPDEAAADDGGESDPPVTRARRRRPRAAAAPVEPTPAAPDASDSSAAPPAQVPQGSDAVAAPPAGEQSELDRLIAGALDDPQRQGQTEAARRDLPQRPTSSQVRAGMQSVVGAANSCGQGEPGRVVVNATILGATGTVGSTSIADSSVSPTVTACVARAVQNARFPRFRNDRFVVRYPFIIR